MFVTEVFTIKTLNASFFSEGLKNAILSFMEKNEVYSTKAFILKKELRGEENERVAFYTQDYGLIYIHSQASRKMQSKLRQQLNLYAFSYINIVQGKREWKLTGVEEIVSPFPFSRSTQFLLLKKIAREILRFGGGEKNEKVWGELEYFFSFLKSEESIKLTEQHRKEIELIISIRILSALGYWNRPGKRLPRYTKEDCELIRGRGMILEKHITEAIKETQL